jgi:phosphotransferase system HPr (HPr) family protein
MKEVTVTVKSRLGLHAYPAAEFVKTAAAYRSEVLVTKDGVEVNGKSIMGILMLGARRGSKIMIRAEGSDEDAVLKALTELMDQDLDARLSERGLDPS